MTAETTPEDRPTQPVSNEGRATWLLVATLVLVVIVALALTGPDPDPEAVQQLSELAS